MMEFSIPLGVDSRATFFEDLYIINVSLKQIGNKTCPTIWGDCDEALKCVGVFVGGKSVPLPGKIPGTFHSKLCAVNYTPNFLHGFEDIGKELA